MIDLAIADDVATIVLNAPSKLNALDERALADLDAAYEAAESAGVRALVLRGEGRAFCAGRDISGVDPRDDDVLGYLGGLVLSAVLDLPSGALIVWTLAGFGLLAQLVPAVRAAHRAHGVARAQR